MYFKAPSDPPLRRHWGAILHRCGYEQSSPFMPGNAGLLLLLCACVRVCVLAGGDQGRGGVEKGRGQGPMVGGQGSVRMWKRETPAFKFMSNTETSSQHTQASTHARTHTVWCIRLHTCTNRSNLTATSCECNNSIMTQSTLGRMPLSVLFIQCIHDLLLKTFFLFLKEEAIFISFYIVLSLLLLHFVLPLEA